jgi:uncharacterized protein (DUF433 family)
MRGTPVFRGTRVPVETMFDYLEGGDTLEDFLEGFPTVSRALAIQALQEAKQLLLARTSGNSVSCYDLARDLACTVKGLPKNLAENAKFMKGLGQ